MSILTFPTTEDRTHIHNLINLYAHGKITLNDEMKWVAHIIKKYPYIERIPIFGYTVRILTYYGDQPIIYIEAQQSDNCPTCGAGTKDAGYLRTEKENLSLDYDLVSVTCLECGCVYTVKGPNGRSIRDEA